MCVIRLRLPRPPCFTPPQPPQVSLTSTNLQLNQQFSFRSLTAGANGGVCGPGPQYSRVCGVPQGGVTSHPSADQGSLASIWRSQTTCCSARYLVGKFPLEGAFKVGHAASRRILLPCRCGCGVAEITRGSERRSSSIDLTAWWNLQIGPV